MKKTNTSEAPQKTKKAPITDAEKEAKKALNDAIFQRPIVQELDYMEIKLNATSKISASLLENLLTRAAIRYNTTRQEVLIRIDFTHGGIQNVKKEENIRFDKFLALCELADVVHVSESYLQKSYKKQNNQMEEEQASYGNHVIRKPVTIEVSKGESVVIKGV